ncbi:MAG TPA: TlpA disulfide reductase family protein [Gemmatimonadales bacterium]|jgi:peroxiredoxin
MSKQWILVAAVLASLLAGATILARFGPDVQQVGVGARAPDFRAIDLATGDSVSLRDHYRGAVTLVNVWATWCEPCRVEMPAMEQAYQALAPQGFRIAAVSIDEGDAEDVRAFGRELGLSFDLLQDRSNRVVKIYQTTGVPESFLLNHEGIIVKRIIGPHDWNSPVNRALIERLLDEPRQ